ncbi:bacterio-opsin activator domain-containing protein [Halomicrobium salinisoli]|uniref:helix-turn-helix domain-containing protein n=1 Tax=Halomicrobium salinisoli TaxID=2878391 RepID=UPI001CF0558E|nr:bacterio-opsin activator domain-containing protein [Halomicrobium salinisoli]
MALQDQRTQPADVVHLEFRLTDPSHPFVGLSTVGDCEVELIESYPRRTGGYRSIYSVANADPDRVLGRAAAIADGGAQFVSRRADGGLLELCTNGMSPAAFLAEGGALPREVTAIGGEGRITAELFAETSDHGVAEAFLATHPTAELVAHRQRSEYTAAAGSRGLNEAVRTRLTDRQREALRAAHEEGYFEWPREATGEDLAERLGITPPTFSQHLRAAERKLVAAAFE